MNLFTYGTLSIPAVLERVCEDVFPRQEGTLVGYARYVLEDRIYPGIVRKEGSQVVGVLHSDVDADHIERLDFFEDDIYQRTTVQIRCVSGDTVKAEAYVIPTSLSYELSDQAWDEAYFVEHYLARYLDGKPVWD